MLLLLRLLNTCVFAESLVLIAIFMPTELTVRTHLT
ncbi:MAG: hypothetical protein ETSY1_06545 [Candidatus Entotheonella factor]|uniref:Uncharacterized protein n=1 Tax=Entotheonella factor TaxID=1429438 RepID=W4LUW3_ENTF1|nr:MAG: hypothetical protein ETSY1_06545 [Candidatus Entotheonella factor]